MSGMVSGLDTESIVTALTSNYQTKVDNYKKAQTKLSWKQDAWKEVNTKINDFYNSLDKYRYSSAWNLQKVTASDSTKAAVSAGGSAFNGTQTLSINALASGASLVGGEVSSIKGTDNTSTAVTGSTKLTALGGTEGQNITLTQGSGDNAKTTATLEIGADTTVNDLVNTLKQAGLNASFDETQHRFYISSQKSGKDQSFKLALTDSTGAEVTSSGNVLDKLGVSASTAAKRSDGSDAEIVLDGVKYTNSSNNFSINGLNIQALAKTDSDITINTQTDTQGIYDKVKEFISSYNDLINDLTDRYNAASSGSYEPLTDDEKSQMSDKQVEKWETKIKTGLLRRDQTLDSLMTTLTNGMMDVYTEGADANGNGGTKVSLATFGIMTKGILQSATNRQNEYHIDGDEDDSSVSSKTDKLMTAITKDPDSVVDFMKDLTTKLSSSLKKQMTSTSLRSVFTVYNDKEMASEYSSYTTQIKEWTTRLNDMQDSYYKKFAKMESMLQELQSNTSSISGMIS